MKIPRPDRKQLIIGVIAAIAVAAVGGLAWSFGQQLVLARQMRAEEERLERAVATEQARHNDLLARLEHVESDEYVERWARVEAKMTKPGEVVVIPAMDMEDESMPADAQTGGEPETARPFWGRWWEAIVGPIE